MAAQSSTQTASEPQQKAIYVYGILPGDVELDSDARGVGEPPGQVRLVRHRDLTALVSDVDISHALGQPEDLRAHKDLLDACAADVPVLPLRFGAVVSSEDAVADELLEAHHDEFASALQELDDQAEYVVKGRYVEQAILEEILAENRQAARLRDVIRDSNPDATRDARIRLGEIVNNAITEKREHDTRVVGDAMAAHAVASVARPPTHERDAVHVAFLVRTGAVEDMERVLGKLAAAWDGRVDMRLMGPMAAYDFIGTTGAEV
jgi:Gas vesicle synthesis protein GvpL/GvpF